MTSATRESVVQTLRLRGKCTVSELADAAGVSPVSVRHHLANLQANGLVSTEEVRHGVGRPRLRYALTDAALELFPSRYLHLSRRLLSEIKESMPQQEVKALLSRVATAMAKEYASRLQGLPLEDRLQRLSQFLADEGFEAEFEQRGEHVLIREIGCPYLRIGRDHPEVCLIDQEFIATALLLPVERVTCILDGDVHCTFTIDIEKPTPRAIPYE